MAILSILQYPDERLYKVAKTVESDQTTRKLVRDMAETMYSAPGIGLAATQVDKHISLIVIDISEKHDDLKIFINPELLTSQGEKENEEGCLSVPGIYENVSRAEYDHRARAQDEHGKSFTLEAEGLLAVCIQHEMDHLHGPGIRRISFASQTNPNSRQAEKAAARDTVRPTHVKIIFAGTPQFAAGALAALIKEHQVVAVLTQPDRPSGRGMQLTASPVKQFALQHGLTLLQPASLKTEESQQATRTAGCGSDGGCRIWVDSAQSGLAIASPRLPEHPCFPVAALAWRGADPTCDSGGRCRNRNHHHANG